MIELDRSINLHHLKFLMAQRRTLELKIEELQGKLEKVDDELQTAGGDFLVGILPLRKTESNNN